MSGWEGLAQGNNQTKVAEIVEEILDEPVIAVGYINSPVTRERCATSSQFVSSFPDIEAEMNAQKPTVAPSDVSFCGVVGHEGNG